ncbi:hypothetical protein ACIRL2_41245 [Embleya sp. NPDC127516]|uniref:hypothetical protein n=1 Tax=Embleya sp. NPDC127516 TaxID=3363990 RepID=UPI0038063866
MELPLLAASLEAGTTAERHEDVLELLHHTGRLQPITDLAYLIAVAHNRATGSPDLAHSPADLALRRINKNWAAPLLAGVAVRTPAEIVDLAELLIGKRLGATAQALFIACKARSSDERLRDLLMETRGRQRNQRLRRVPPVQRAEIRVNGISRSHDLGTVEQAAQSYGDTAGGHGPGRHRTVTRGADGSSVAADAPSAHQEASDR